MYFAKLSTLNGNVRLKFHFICTICFEVIIRIKFNKTGGLKEMSNHGFVAHPEAFSAATLIYTRLRRVSGRVIDAMYLAENKAYAKHVVDLAFATGDAELVRQAERLRSFMDLDTEIEPEVVPEKALENTHYREEEVTEDEIYRAQVHHHYIGALR